MSQTVFITGSSTGVGKTVLTALLLHHLRQSGCRALALKPFCSGGQGDARLLWNLEKQDIPLNQVNPFYRSEPLAFWVDEPAKPGDPPPLTLARALEPIRVAQAQCDTLLIEGSGGLLVPLGPDFFVADLIAACASSVIVAAPNILGTISHTLMTVNELRNRGVRSIRVALMGVRRNPDPSAASNAPTLARFLGPVPLIEVPYLGPSASTLRAVKSNTPVLRETLARLV